MHVSNDDDDDEDGTVLMCFGLIVRLFDIFCLTATLKTDTALHVRACVFRFN